MYTELGATTTDYLAVNGQTVVELKKVGTTTTPTYLHPDLLGSPRKATSQAKAILWSEHYDPYGRKLNGVNQKIGYTGHAYDPESGYTYMQARFYDPLVGRFLSTDPIHFLDDNPFTFNRYSYANNNPYRYTDPTGMCTGTRICNDDGTTKLTGGYTTGSNGSTEGVSRQKAQSMATSGASTEQRRSTADSVGDSLETAPQAGLELTGALELAETALRTIVALQHRDKQEAADVLTAGAVGLATQKGGVLSRVGGKLFGKGGILNNNRYLRIGIGRKGGNSVFRITGKLVGDKKIDLIDFGPLPRIPKD